MTSNLVHSRTTDGVCVITIDNQDKLNALNMDVISGLERAFGAAASDAATRVVILTGAGTRAFVAGADIAEIQALEADTALQLVQRVHALMALMQNMGKPVIAAINGFALGGGCEFALACTIRIASSSAMLGLPEVKLGLIPGYGGTQRISRLLGRGRALHLMLTGDPINAQQALEWGLVSQVVEPEALMTVVEKLAAKLACSAPLAMRGILAAVHGGTDLPLEEGLAHETEQFCKLFGSEDMREGTAAFLEKRRPNFKGQ